MTRSPVTSDQSDKDQSAALALAACSAFTLRVLAALAASQDDISAGWLADKVWPQKTGRYLGYRSGRWQKMGAVLNKMHALGLVWRTCTEHKQNLWTISNAGKRILSSQNK
jgi:hypothetical protein